MGNMIFFIVITVVALILPVAGIWVDIYLKRINHKWGKHGVIAAVASTLIMFALFLTVSSLISPNIIGGATVDLLSNATVRIAILVLAVPITILMRLALIRIFSASIINPVIVGALVLVCVLPYSYYAVTLTNAAFDFNEPQTISGTIENRTTGSTMGSVNTTTYRIHISVDEYDDELRIRVPRRFYNSVRVGDEVYVCTKPGLWGFEWMSCIHRVDRHTGRIHPDDNAPHLQALP